jgi:hypothetical protein
MKRTRSSTILLYNWNTKQYTFAAELQEPVTLATHRALTDKEQHQ